jgi:NAD(P)-dependent dehydrogenase (short-subunit alcohol dehydrogenase family)
VAEAVREGVGAAVRPPRPGPVVSVVTGAGSGIGRAVAHRLAARGDRVVCADLDRSAADATVKSLENPDHGVAVAVDVAVAGDNDRMVALAVERFSGVDVFVACAGIELGGPAHELGEDAFARTLAVNLTGVFLGARAAARVMLDQGAGGRMVLIGSINSAMALPGQAAYCASKGGVLMLGKALAVDWAPHGIGVNVVGPGVVDTPMSGRSLADPERRAMLMGRTPLGRPAQPEEIAELVEFLASPRASYLTGAYVAADGGWLAG